MVIFRCMAKDFWLEKVVMPFENYIFDAPKDADVEIMGLDKTLTRHYRIDELDNLTVQMYTKYHYKGLERS